MKMDCPPRNSKNISPPPENAPKIDWALFHAENGIPVFRLQPDKKEPLTGLSWVVDATTNPDKIRHMWSGDHADCNIGLAMVGFAAFDYDVKPKQDGTVGKGNRTKIDFERSDALPKTAEQETPTGGIHSIFTIDPSEKIRNSTSKIGDDVDVRGHNGFIVGAGSTINNRPYKWLGGDFKRLPKGFVAKCGTPRERDRESQLALVELDQSPQIRRAIQYLENYADEAKQGEHGNATTFRVACELKDYGISEGYALELLLLYYNETKCSPAWPVDELANVVAHAYQYGKSPPGIADPSLEFQPADGLEIGNFDERPLSRGKFVDATRKTTFEFADEAVRDTIPTTGVGFIGGQSGALKTFAALDLAVCIATGTPFAGRKIEKPGGVIFAAFEGEGTLQGRLLARRTRLEDPDTELPILILEQFGMVKELEDYLAFEESLRTGASRIRRQMDVPLRAIFIDTVTAASMLPEDSEKDPAAWQRVFDYLQKISKALNVVIILVHHYGKDATAGLRGSSAARAAADFVLAMTCKRDELTGETEDHRLSLTKSRTAPEGPIAAVRKTPVVVGYRSDGTEATSLVLDFDTSARAIATKPQPDDDVTDEQMAEIQARAGEPVWRKDTRADKWIGVLVAEVLGADLKNSEDRDWIKSCVDLWLENGVFEEVEAPDANRMTRTFVVSNSDRPSAETEFKEASLDDEEDE